MNNSSSSVTADTRKFMRSGRQALGVTVSLVGEFVSKTSPTTDGVSRRFRVDTHCIAGGCSGEFITLYAKPPHDNLVGAIPDRIVVELSNVYVVNKGTHSYALANHNFTTDYEPVRPKKKVQKNTARNPSRARKVTARAPKVKPTRGKYK